LGNLRHGFLRIFQVLQDSPAHAARTQAYLAVNHAMVEAYWNIGRLIVEEEQAGKSRAVYGTHFLEGLAERLTIEFGRVFFAGNLKNFRQFYLVFPRGYREGDIPYDEIGYTVCSGFLLVALPAPDAGGKSRGPPVDRIKLGV